MAAAATALCLAGCSASTLGSTSPSSQGSPGSSAGPQTVQSGPGGAGPPTLVTMPGGIATIDTLVSTAQHSLDMTMYELADSHVEDLLEADAARGVTVRVLLQGGYVRRQNQADTRDQRAAEPRPKSLGSPAGRAGRGTSRELGASWRHQDRHLSPIDLASPAGTTGRCLW